LPLPFYCRAVPRAARAPDRARAPTSAMHAHLAVLRARLAPTRAIHRAGLRPPVHLAEPVALGCAVRCTALVATMRNTQHATILGGALSCARAAARHRAGRDAAAWHARHSGGREAAALHAAFEHALARRALDIAVVGSPELAMLVVALMRDGAVDADAWHEAAWRAALAMAAEHAAVPPSPAYIDAVARGALPPAALVRSGSGAAVPEDAVALFARTCRTGLC